MFSVYGLKLRKIVFKILWWFTAIIIMASGDSIKLSSSGRYANKLLLSYKLRDNSDLLYGTCCDAPAMFRHMHGQA